MQNTRAQTNTANPVATGTGVCFPVEARSRQTGASSANSRRENFSSMCGHATRVSTTLGISALHYWNEECSLESSAFWKRFLVMLLQEGRTDITKKNTPKNDQPGPRCDLKLTLLKDVCVISSEVATHHNSRLLTAPDRK